MKRLLSIFALCSFAQAEEVINDKFLDSVAMIESGFNPAAVGDKGKALGAYQLHQEAWTDGCKWVEHNDSGNHTAWSWAFPHITNDWKRYAKDPVMSRVVARGYFSLLQYRFNKRGIKPTAIQLYMAYNMGFRGASECNFDFTHYKLSDTRACILKRANFILSK